MKRLVFAAVAVMLTAVAAIAQENVKKFSILGDSYSTYEGHVNPAWNAVWYGDSIGIKKNRSNDVNSVESTWWTLLDKTPGYKLDVNNSFSGSTVCLTGYSGNDYSDRAFFTRVYNLGNPDIILVFGGTNDSWAGSPIGDYVYEDWTKEQLYSFRPAFAMLLSQLRAIYPNAKIYNILNTELRDEINESTEEICRHYGIVNIQPAEIDKREGHPSVKGMQQIYEAVLETLERE